MDPIYELISDTEMKITQPLPPQETVVTFDELEAEKLNLAREIDDFNTRAAFETGNRKTRIVEIDQILSVAASLKG